MMIHRFVLLLPLMFVMSCSHMEKGQIMSEYYVGYSYGMGGHWFLVEANSEDAILAFYPDVEIYKERPPFINDLTTEIIKEKFRFKLGEASQLQDKVLKEASEYK